MTGHGRCFHPADADYRGRQQQACHNTKEQFATSPDLPHALQNAIMESFDAHTSMSTQALNSPIVLRGMLDVLLNHTGLYKALRARGGCEARGSFNQIGL